METRVLQPYAHSGTCDGHFLPIHSCVQRKYRQVTRTGQLRLGPSLNIGRVDMRWTVVSHQCRETHVNTLVRSCQRLDHPEDTNERTKPFRRGKELFWLREWGKWREWPIHVTLKVPNSEMIRPSFKIFHPSLPYILTYRSFIECLAFWPHNLVQL